MQQKGASITIMRKPASACQTPATIQMGLMEMQLKTPNRMAAGKTRIKISIRNMEMDKNMFILLKTK